MADEKKHMFDEGVESILCKQVYDLEVTQSRSNTQQLNDDFDKFVGMLDGQRHEKGYDWQSDIHIPEFTTQINTQLMNDAGEYFVSLDFAEVYLQDKKPESLAAAKAAKEVINKTLNQRHLRFFPKYMRARSINYHNGSVVFYAWWDAKKDKFNFDVVDPRNVFFDNTYTYSLQEKSWIILRCERSLSQLKAEARAQGYFNLDLLEDENEAIGSPQDDTEAARDTYNKDDGFTNVRLPKDAMVDVYKRYGTMWCLTDGVDEDGFPINVRPAVMSDGKISDEAELIECVLTIADKKNKRTLIGFHATPYIDAEGEPYKPFCRGLCYIHPLRDRGLGDAEVVYDLQVAVDDVFNMAQDRSRLSLMPMFWGNKNALDDMDTVFFSPGNIIHTDDPKGLNQLIIDGNVAPAVNQNNWLTSKMNQSMAIYPNIMGDVGAASTTATAIGSADQRSDQRTHGKSLIFEHTALTELFWMILQMTHRFAGEETAFKLLGDMVYDFNPNLDYIYKPVSQAIESEYSKATKLKVYQGMLQVAAMSQNPKAAAVYNQITAEMFQLLGKETEQFADALMDESAPMQESATGSPPGMGGATGAIPASNQTGMPQSMPEMAARSQYDA